MSNTPTRTRALQEVPAAAALAVELLTSDGPAITLSADDARGLLPYWRLVDAPAGAALMAEGDQLHTGHMLLVLEGQVTVDSGADHVALAVVGPGQLLGELALLDGQPRSASCTATTPVRAAALSRQALQRLLEEHPALAARLLAVIAQRIGERLRAFGDQLLMYSQMVQGLQERLERIKT